MPHLDHIALVVRELEPALARCQAAGLPAGPIEDFPAEGTREVYLGDSTGSALLLLMQPTSDEGPYARALRKRGPGLHHVALRVPQLERFARELRGWLLHPASLETLASSRTVWLARPGVGALVEVCEGRADPGPPAIEALELPLLDAGLRERLVLGADGDPIAGLGWTDGAARLRIAERWHAVAALVGEQ